MVEEDAWRSFLFLSLVGHAVAQSINGPISENVSLLDSGLTALAAISTVVVTLVRRRLDAEIGLRQWQNESRRAVALTVRPEKGMIFFGFEHSFETMDGLLLSPKAYWRAARDFCQYAAINHSAVPCLLLLVGFMDLPDVEHSGFCQAACTCIASLYIEELEPILALTYRSSVRVYSMVKLPETDPDRDWYVYQCKSCIRGECHHGITRELRVPDPVPLDMRDITRCDENSLGEALDSNSGYLNDLFSVSNQALLLPVRRMNRNIMMSMFGLSLEGMDAVSRNRLHSLTSGLRLPDYRASEDYTAAWQGSIGGVHACEVLVNLLLVFIFRIDPMSSALAARRAVRGYTVDSTGSSVTLAEYLQAARVVKREGLIDGVVQMRLPEDARGYRIMRLVPAAGNVLGLILWSTLILLGKHPVKWTGGYEAVLANWALYVLLFPLVLSMATAVATWTIAVVTGIIVLRPYSLRVALVLLAPALLIMALIITALIFVRYHFLRRALQVGLAWLSFFQWRLGIELLGPGGPDQSPPELWVTLVYAHTFVLTGFLAATGGKWQ